MKMRNMYKILVGKPGERRPFVRYRHTWDNIKMYLKDTGFRGQCQAPTNMLVNLQVSYKVGNF
jgi:hypothetical protein